MQKKTRLDDRATIYQPRKEQTEKEKLKDMKFKDKLSYLWEYYKIEGTILFIVIFLAIYGIYQIITPNVHTKLYAAIINSTVPTDIVQDYGDEFASFQKMDPKTEEVVMNDTLSATSSSDYATNLQQALVAFIAAKEVDVIIVPETEFKSYVGAGYFAKLSDELPTDVYSSLTDYFYISSTPDDAEKSAYGIYLTNSDLFKDATYKGDPYVIGIVANYQHKDNTVAFIKYLFKN